MFKKIKKQKSKIAKLEAKETELREKLEAVLQEKSEEQETLEGLEKECLFNIIRDKNMSFEDTVKLLKGEEAEEIEDPEEAEDEEEPEVQAGEDSFFGRFGRRDDQDNVG